MSKEHPEHLDCPFDFLATQEEYEALEWLNKTFDAIIEKGSEHRSYKNAVLCKNFLNGVGEHTYRMHELAHLLMHGPEEGSEMAKKAAEMQMRMQPMGKA